jgi:hypothetical protein
MEKRGITNSLQVLILSWQHLIIMPGILFLGKLIAGCKVSLMDIQIRDVVELYMRMWEDLDFLR